MKSEISRQRTPECRNTVRRGKHSGSVRYEPRLKAGASVSDIDLPATLRSKELRLKRYRRKKQCEILFVVDASRSQGANERLAFAKGAVMAILEKAYSGRERVGMIVFGDGKAEQVLPYTKSVDFAARKMEGLPARGNTPLSMGMRLAVRTVGTEQEKYPDFIQIVVLLTDGKSNYDVEEGKLMELTMKAAGEIRDRDIHLLVVDTENSVFGMGIAGKIADEAAGTYVRLL